MLSILCPALCNFLLRRTESIVDYHSLIPLPLFCIYIVFAFHVHHHFYIFIQYTFSNRFYRRVCLQDSTSESKMNVSEEWQHGHSSSETSIRRFLLESIVFVQASCGESCSRLLKHAVIPNTDATSMLVYHALWKMANITRHAPKKKIFSSVTVYSCDRRLFV